MKNQCFIEGQICIFDLPVIEVLKPKEIIIKKENKEIDRFDSIINRNNKIYRKV